MGISVVVTAHNKEREISRALKSVRGQTVEPTELIVVDDGSTDNTVPTVEGLNLPGLRLVRQGNTGVYGSKNRGVAESRCDLIAFLDGDDTWEPGFLEAISEMRVKYPDCGLYGTGWCKRTVDGKTVVPRLHCVPPFGEGGILDNYFVSVSRGEMLCSSAVAVSRGALKNVGMFPNGEGRGGDRETWLRIAVDYPIAFHNSVLATWHLDASNRVSNTDGYSVSHPVVRTGERILLRKDLPARTRRGLARHVVRTRIFLARQLIMAGKPEDSRMVLLERGIPSICTGRWLACLCGTYLPKEMFCRLYNIRCLFR